MKRQDTLRSSSPRTETPFTADQTPTTTRRLHHAKAVGCMAGIFHLVSAKYQNRRKFLLTFGKKEAVKSSKKRKTGAGPPLPPPPDTAKEELSNLRRLSCEVPRSPTIPAEIRRSISFTSPERNSTITRSPPAVVARLMGLDEIPAPATPDSAAEKRRKLLNALEKCDEDLKALRRIIEAVRGGDRLQIPPQLPRKVCSENGGNLRRVSFEVKTCVFPSGQLESSGGGSYGGLKKPAVDEQPSPVSVLDGFTRSPPSAGCTSPKHTKNGRLIQQKLNRKNLGEDCNASLRFLDRVSTITTRSFHPKVGRATTGTTLWSTNRSSMVETVNEVCRDIAWGQDREAVKVGLVIQEHIFRDLIEQITSELRCFNLRSSSFISPLICKRKLSF